MKLITCHVIKVMLYHDPSSRVSWVEFEFLAQNTITSAQTVIQQLTVLLGTGKHVYGHRDETEANPKLHLSGKANSNSLKNIISREDYEGYKSEYDAKYFEKIVDNEQEPKTSEFKMLAQNVKEEHCLDSNQDESFDTYTNGMKVSLDNTLLDEGVNPNEDGYRYLKYCVTPTKVEETKPSNTNNDKVNEVDTSNLRMVVSNLKQERSWDYNGVC